MHVLARSADIGHVGPSASNRWRPSVQLGPSRLSGPRPGLRVTSRRGSLRSRPAPRRDTPIVPERVPLPVLPSLSIVANQQVCRSGPQVPGGLGQPLREADCDALPVKEWEFEEVREILGLVGRPWVRSASVQRHCRCVRTGHETCPADPTERDTCRMCSEGFRQTCRAPRTCSAAERNQAGDPKNWAPPNEKTPPSAATVQ